MRTYTTTTAPSSTPIILAPDWRVRPLDDLQWVLERRTVKGGGRWKGHPGHLKHGGEAWLPQAYCHTRAGLESAVTRLKAAGVDLDPAPLAALPENFDGEPLRRSRRALLDGRPRVDPSGEEIIAGVRMAVAGDIELVRLTRLLQTRRRETVPLLARIGLQDDGSVDDLRRLARSLGNPMDDRPPDPDADAVAKGKVVACRSHQPKLSGRRGLPVSLGWRRQVRG